MRRGIVPELNHARMPVERRLHDAALNASSAAVHQAHFADAGGRRRFDVLRDDGGNLARREGVEVELALDRDSERQKLKGRRQKESVQVHLCLLPFAFFLS